MNRDSQPERGTGADGDDAQRGDTERGSDGLRRIDARALLSDEREVILVHGRQEYRLRCTSSGKLILTK